MKLITPEQKKIMEACKRSAYADGLCFLPPGKKSIDGGNDYIRETLEYMISNREIMELQPKSSLPHMFDHPDFDVDVLTSRKIYDVNPRNPLETIINTQPFISFYNRDNPDWINTMLFYHVLGHIDFYANNVHFKHTWDYDFNTRSKAHKSFIANMRKEQGHWVDYVIEFTRSMNFLVNYHQELASYANDARDLDKAEFYFENFLPNHDSVGQTALNEHIIRYKALMKQHLGNPQRAEEIFFSEVALRFPEFNSVFERNQNNANKIISFNPESPDIINHIIQNSPFLNNSENSWMKDVMSVVHQTELYLAGQRWTKFLNEGWATSRHLKLFMDDPHFQGNEVNFSSLNAMATAAPKIGLNPYALGLDLFDYIEKSADKGKYLYYHKLLESEGEASAGELKELEKSLFGLGLGKQKVFDVRKNCCDRSFINNYVTEEFMDQYGYFVVGRIEDLDPDDKKMRFYIRSRDPEEYKKVTLDSLFYPPRLNLANPNEGISDKLHIEQEFDENTLSEKGLANILMGMEFLCKVPVVLDTYVVQESSKEELKEMRDTNRKKHQGRFIFVDEMLESFKPKWEKVRYTMDNGELKKTKL